MSFYYKYKFTSPEPLYAKIKEELKSYFNTGAVDDTLFPLWVDDCLKKLGKSSYPVNQTVLPICDFQSSLPPDFHAIREAWACEVYNSSYQLPNATYTQISTRLDDPDVYCNLCSECQIPDIIQAVYKTTNTVLFEWKRQYLLTPGNIYPACPKDLYCANYNAVGPNSYDVRDDKFSTTFREGTVYIQYYSNSFDSDQLIPDDFRIMRFIELYLKEKIFEQLSNQTTDETFNQIRQKYADYKAQADEAFILAEINNKKEDVYRKQRAIRRTKNRFRKYDIR